MEVTIITGPNSNLNIEKELHLVKVGLLYSDKVNIVSPSLTVILLIVRLSTLSENEKFQLFREIIPLVNPQITPLVIDQLYKKYKLLKSKKGKNKEEMHQFMMFKSTLNNFEKDINSQAEKLITNSGILEGIHLLEDGSLSLDILNFGKDPNDYINGIVNETIRVITDINSYPIFDEFIEDLANSWIKENSPEFSINASELKLSKELMLQLPNLDELSFHELLNLKETLILPLERFKSLVYNMSKSINEIPYSEKSRSQIDKIYEREIKPQLLELQQEIDNNRLINKFFKHFLESATKYSVFLGITSVSDLQNLLLGAGGLTLTETLIKSNNEKIKKQKEIKSNALYFYHQLSKL